MAATVHPTALVAPGVQLGEGTNIGPYAMIGRGSVLGEGSCLGAFACVGEECSLGAGLRMAERSSVGDHVVLGPGVELGVGALVEGPSQLGSYCQVFPGAVIGAAPQDRSFAGEPTELQVGERVIFREQVTVHRGTKKGGSITRVGSHCLLMVGVHVAHDCRIGDHVQLANLTTLGGHVVLGDHVVSGGHVAIAPFVTIGRGTFLAGGSMVEGNLPPFVIAGGDRARVRVPNRVGLARCGVPDASKKAVLAAFRALYSSRRTWLEGLAEAERRGAADPYVAELLSALRG